MNTACFLKVDAPNNRVDGTTTDESQEDAIEILSFEHSIERAPVRETMEPSFSRLETVRQRYEDNRSTAEFRELRRLQRREVTQIASVALASNLELLPVILWKMVDKSSPVLNHWATDQTLLTSATLTIRTQVMHRKKFEFRDFLKVVVKKAFISQMETSFNPSFQSPVEKIAIVYQQIEWSVNEAAPVFKWDKKRRKALT